MSQWKPITEFFKWLIASIVCWIFDQMNILLSLTIPNLLLQSRSKQSIWIAPPKSRWDHSIENCFTELRLS